MFVIKCKRCGLEKKRKKRGLFCSLTCWYSYLRKEKNLFFNCSYCGRIHKNYHPEYKKHYCSLKCKKLHIKSDITVANNWRGSTVKKICILCSKEFTTRRKTSKFCSVGCKNIFRKKEKVQLFCIKCKKYFLVFPSVIKWNKIREHKITFCSIQCKHEYYKGENSPVWIKDRKKLSKKYRGILNKEWRNFIYLRDKYTCQLCGKKHTYFEAHHIKKWSKYPELRLEVTNGITLCRKPCHLKTMGNEEKYEKEFKIIAVKNTQVAKREGLIFPFEKGA